MTTRLYFHVIGNGLANLPGTEQSSLTSNKDAESQIANHHMDTTIGVGQNSIVLSSIASTSLQRYFFTRFVSNPLSGISSISAQTWTYNFASIGSSVSSNFPCSSTNQPVRVMAYVWRPSTQSKVGDIVDGNSASTVSEPAAASERSQQTTFTGSSVASVADGDVICFEIWFEITQAAATAYTDTFFYDGTTVTANTGTVVTNHASFIETPQDLTFGTAVLATRLFFHVTNSALSNLPTTTQSSLTATVSVDAATVNRIMDATIGTSQTSLAISSAGQTAQQNQYFTRFVTDTLSGITTIPAGMWVYNFAIKESSTNANFPVTATSQPTRIVAYVWRPGTGKVGNILDGDSLSTIDEASNTTSEYSENTQFAGSSVVSVQNGDVICFEVWFRPTQAAATVYTDTFYYDGTTILATSSGTVVTSHASYLESPIALVLGAPVGPVTTTPTGKTIYNKTTRHA